MSRITKVFVVFTKLSSMKLASKGRIIPPPVLGQYPEMVSKEIQQWKDIIAATHWEIHDRNAPNGADFYVGELELGHIHLDGELHVPSTREFSQALLNAGLAQKFPYAANWIAFKIHDQPSANHAIWLFELHYKNLTGADTEQLLQSIADYPG